MSDGWGHDIIIGNGSEDILDFSGVKEKVSFKVISDSLVYAYTGSADNPTNSVLAYGNFKDPSKFESVFVEKATSFFKGRLALSEVAATASAGAHNGTD